MNTIFYKMKTEYSMNILPPKRTLIMRADNSVPEVPAGTIMECYGEVPDDPSWIIPDGHEVLRSRYADLFAAIGTLYGKGDGNLTFNLPDCRATVK